MRRHLLGLIALGLFGFAAVVCLYPPLASSQVAGQVVLRVAIVLGVFWLAWPDLDRLPRWFWLALPIGLVVLIYAKGALFYAVPALAVVATGYIFYRRLRRSA